MEKDLNRSQIAALKAYPNVEQPVWDESYPKTLFVRHTERNAFIKGYEQAEKDFALTINDLELLHTFLYAIKNNKQGCFTFTRLSDEQYEEVLRRFNEAKKK